MILIRYTSDGILDTSFGPSGGGIVQTNMGSGDDYAQALKIQSDDKIIIAGRSSSNDFAIIRFTADGELDTTFGPDGGVTTPIGSGQDWAYALSIQSDGKIVLAGRADTGLDNFALARYTSSGALDKTFGTNGSVTTEIVNASAWGVETSRTARSWLLAAHHREPIMISRWFAILPMEHWIRLLVQTALS